MSNSSVSQGALLGFFDTLGKEIKDDRRSRETNVSFAMDRLVGRMRKRAELKNPNLAADAVAKFLATNTAVGNRRIILDRDVECAAREFIVNLLERYALRIDPDNIQTVLDPSHLYELWRFGPGASFEVSGTHAAVKVGSEFTCTPKCEPAVKILRAQNVYFSSFDLEHGTQTRIVRGSRLTTVPKNEDTERTIAIEPLGNMCLQLAAGTYLERALATSGLDIHCQQPKNKLLALRGSIDDSLATIDMKSASDLIGMDLVRLLLPQPWITVIERFRSEEIRVPGGEWVTLNMVSTMGNGFTFPLMTLIFTALLYANRRVHHKGPRNFIDWSCTAVYGDDIIVPSQEYDSIVDVLQQAGFIINRDKSFSVGPFRESCGGDYFEGYDVTPFYVRRLDSDASVYVALNQVLDWCGRHKIYLTHTVLYLRSLLRGKVHFVPEWFDPTCGIRTALVPRRFTFLKALQQREKLDSPYYAMMLACGGYLTSSDSDDLFYVPRQFKTRYVVAKSRLPRGWRDGSDPVRGAATTLFVTCFVDLLFNMN